MQKPLVVAFGLAGIGTFAGLQPGFAKTVPYSNSLSPASLRFECGLMGGTFSEYTDKAGRHYYWCTTSTGTIKCLDNICTQTTPDKKRLPPTNVATGNNNQKVGNKPKPPVAATNAAGAMTSGKSIGVGAVASPGAGSSAVSGTTNAGAVSATKKTPTLTDGAFSGSNAPTLRSHAGTTGRKLP